MPNVSVGKVVIMVVVDVAVAITIIIIFLARHAYHVVAALLVLGPYSRQIFKLKK